MCWFYTFMSVLDTDTDQTPLTPLIMCVGATELTIEIKKTKCL
jgi:hypothetical protein